MLFKEKLHPNLRNGTVTLAFRRWKRPTVKTGGTLRTPAGVLAIDDVKIIDREEITDADIDRTGFDSRQELLEDLRDGEDRELYRIEFHYKGEDPRIKLRRDDDLDADTVIELTNRLDHLDSYSPEFPWTRPVLRIIAEQPDTSSGELARQLECEKEWLKRKVRKLKELGLTESRQPGYRLSPRGRALLETLEDASEAE